MRKTAAAAVLAALAAGCSAQAAPAPPSAADIAFCSQVPGVILSASTAGLSRGLAMDVTAVQVYWTATGPATTTADPTFARLRGKVLADCAAVQRAERSG